MADGLVATNWEQAYRIADEHGYPACDMHEVRRDHPDQPEYLVSYAAIPGTMGHPRLTIRVQ